LDEGVVVNTMGSFLPSSGTTDSPNQVVRRRRRSCTTACHTTSRATTTPGRKEGTGTGTGTGSTFENKVLADHDMRSAGKTDRDAREAVSDGRLPAGACGERVVPGLVRSDETPAEHHPVVGRVFRPPPDVRDTRDGEDRGRHLSPLLILAVAGHEVRVSASPLARGRRSRAPISCSRAPWKRAHYRRSQHMLSSDFRRGLRVRLITAMRFLARHARHFENFTPNF